VTASQKSDLSPVTIADRDAERAIRAVLAAHFPTHGRLGEEEGLENPGSSLRWVFDPIDGTRAFITGRPLFGTLIALLEDDIPIIGLLDQPVTGERWLGVRGRPTEFTGPLGGTAGTRRGIDLGAAELSCTGPEIFRPAEQARFASLARQVKRITWGGDCYAYGLLALGQIDMVAEATLKIWDWAALVPIIEGAGGSLTDWQGHPMHAAGDGTALALGDPALVDRAVAALEKSKPGPAPNSVGRSTHSRDGVRG
jgi:myo-inositol-1(or 4)-monophosphatase